MKILENSTYTKLWTYFCFAILLFIANNNTEVLAQLNCSLVGNLDYEETLNDVWGYEQGGTEYALIGNKAGTSIVSLEDPSNPVELFFVGGPNSTWRDIKTFSHYAYVTNETDTGLHIIDLQGLPNSIVDYVWQGGIYGEDTIELTTAHNMFVDENGIGYVIGSNYSIGGVIMLDLNENPIEPPIIGVYDVNYVHDAFIRNDTLWTAEIYAGYFGVVDISDKSSPQVLAVKETPSQFTHNLWLSDDGNTLFTTDEVSSAFVGAYDVSNLFDIKEVGRYQSNPGSGVIPHNTFVLGDYVLTSYYRDGFTIVDASYPYNMIETANYDSAPTISGDGFEGCWGVYPYLSSGLILTSDRQNGLFVFDPNYVKGCYLEGKVTSSVTGANVPGAKIEILDSDQVPNFSSLFGDYATGIAASGTYDVVAFRYGYLRDTATVELINGELVIQDFVLEPATPFNLTIQVEEEGTGLPIAGAEVSIDGNYIPLQYETDELGQINIDVYYEDVYQIIAGKWGFKTSLFSDQLLNSELETYTISLPKGYYDDFYFDFGWTAISSADNGIWKRAIPQGATIVDFTLSPYFDLDSDFGKHAFITGDGNFTYSNVDNGETKLFSPLFDGSQYVDPVVSYYRWFFAFNNSDDTLRALVSNGLEIVELDLVGDFDPFESQWEQTFIRLKDHIEITSSMQLIFEVSDLEGSEHFVNAGLDQFEINEFQEEAPVAAFTSDIVSGCAPLEVNFSGIDSENTSGYKWYLYGSNQDFSYQDSPTVIYSEEGSYEVSLVVVNSTGKDSIAYSAYVEVLPSLEVNISSSTGIDIICPGEEIELSVSTNFSSVGTTYYNWTSPEGITTQTGSPFFVYTPSQTSQFEVEVLTPEGCSASSSFFLDVAEPINFNFVEVPSPCFNEEFNSEMDNPNLSYEWYQEGELISSEPSVSIALQQETIFVVTGTDEFGCSNSFDFIVEPSPELTLEIIGPDIICTGNSFVLSSGEEPIEGWEYEWTGPGIISNDGSSIVSEPSYEILDGIAEYFLVATDSEGCSVSDSISVIMGICDGINESQNLNDLKIVYQNSKHSILLISDNFTNEAIEGELFDISGKLIQKWEKLNFDSQNKIEIQLNQLQKGLYLVHFSGNSKKYNQKILVK